MASSARVTSQPGVRVQLRLVLAHWVYAGTGLTDAEAWLAETLEPAPGTEGEPTHG
ncbi:hypothetical protein [Streptomyces griseoluteus]|uniref:hypothetical protein n=1 Tax=Streptomyces griseoluteus TaxID=29306 RepID=UPI00365B361E